MGARAARVAVAIAAAAVAAAACTTHSDLPYGGSPTPAGFHLVSSDPADASAGAGLGSALTAVFSAPVEPVTVGPVSVRLTRVRDGATLAGTIAVASSAITFRPDAPLDVAASYRLVLGSALASTTGDPLAADVNVRFQTRDGQWSAPVTLCQATYGCTDVRISTLGSAEAVVYVGHGGLASEELELAQPNGLTGQWASLHVDGGKSITPWVIHNPTDGGVQILYIIDQKLKFDPIDEGINPQMLSSTASTAALVHRASDVALVWSEYDTVQAKQKLVVATRTPNVLSKASIADNPSGNVDVVDIPGGDTIAAFIASGRSGYTHPWGFSSQTLLSKDLEPSEAAFTRVVRLAPDPTTSHGIRAFWAEDTAIYTGDAALATPQLVASGIGVQIDGLDAVRVGSTWWLLATASSNHIELLYENSGAGWSLASNEAAGGAALAADAEGNLLLVRGATGGNATVWAERRLAATGVWAPAVAIDAQSGTFPVLGLRPGGHLLLTLQHLPVVGLTVSELR